MCALFVCFIYLDLNFGKQCIKVMRMERKAKIRETEK